MKHRKSIITINRTIRTKNFHLRQILYKMFLMFMGGVLGACSPQETLNGNDAEYAVSMKGGEGILGGEAVKITDPLSPYVVGILRKVERDGRSAWFQTCTGVRIKEGWILTAAHCVAGHPINNLWIHRSLTTVTSAQQSNQFERVSEDEIKQKMQPMEVEEAILLEPAFAKGVVVKNRDLAIVKIKETGNFPSEELRIPTVETLNKISEKNGNVFSETFLYGYGIAQESPRVSPGFLKKTILSSKVEGDFITTDQTHGTGACSGDSGGPLFVFSEGYPYLLGTTQGPKAGFVTCDKEGAYINLSLWRSFIESHVGTLKE